MDIALDQLAQTILQDAASAGISLRLCGGMAVQLRSKEKQALRHVSDLDFVCALTDRLNLRSLLNKKFNFYEDSYFATIPSAKRSRFHGTGVRCDVFYDGLSFCHSLDLRKRLTVDPISIPLAELALSKLQIVTLEQKDIRDVICLFREHDVRDCDGESINRFVITDICRRDWGLEKTVRGNLFVVLDKIMRDRSARAGLEVIERILLVLSSLEHAQKTFKWRARSLIGENVRWYRDVDPVDMS